jgi:photosystem II stability/assembly factor-like uncharacterized protein
MKILAMFLLFLLPEITHTQTPFWRQTNGPYGGTVRSFTETRSGAMFAVSFGGIFRSTNGGVEWQRMPFNLTNSTRYTAVTADSNNNIFVGAVYDFFIGGIYRSTDLGETWTSTTSFPNVLCFTISASGNMFAGFTGGMLRSTDQGNSWTMVLSNGKYCGSAASVQSAVVLAGTDSGIYRSTDNGLSWQVSNNGLTSINVHSLISTSSNLICAGTDGGVFRSSDNGVSWASSGLFSDTISALAGALGGELFAGTPRGKLYHSTDNGTSWELWYNFAAAVLGLRATDSNNIAASIYGNGLHRYNASSRSWTLIGVPNTPVKLLSSEPQGRLYSVVNNALYFTTDRGGHWELLRPFANQISALIVSPTSGQLLLGIGNNIYKSNDRGMSFDSTRVDSAQVTSIAVDSSGRIYAGVFLQGIFRSTDNGLTWRFSGLGGGYVTSIVANHSGDLFATTNAWGVYRSTDHGENWTNVDNGLTGGYVWCGSISPYDHIYVSGNYGTFKSTDNGINWQNIDPGSPIQGRSIAFNSNGHVFIARTGGVAHSTNGGNDWTTLLSGLSDTHVLSVSVDRDDYVLAGTAETGVFVSVARTTEVTIHHEMHPRVFTLGQSYPNPFNPSTIIPFSVGTYGHISLEVFDLLGRKVATLVNEVRPPGTYMVQFGAPGLASGVYLYRLATPLHSETRKLMLAK